MTGKLTIQNDYFSDGRMELVGSIQAAAATARLLAAFRKRSWPVIHIQHISIQPGATFFLPESHGVAIHSSVSPLATEPVITKHSPNSFRGTGLQEHLRILGIDTLLVCGMMSHMCVDATVRAAFDLGYSCIVAHDGCATRELIFNEIVVSAAHVHASYMAALGAVYAQVKRVDEILENTVV